MVHTSRRYCPSTLEDPVTTTDIDTADPPAVDQQALLVGRRIRGLRRDRKLTLVQLAAAAELSHPFLSQLERGLARPSMVSLERIARALGSSQVELLADDDDAPVDQPGIVLVRAGEGSHGRYGESDGRMLTHGHRGFSPMELVGTNVDPGDYFAHAEDEFVYVLDGTVIVDLGDDAPRTLTPGDSLYFVGGTPHRWKAADESGYRIIVVKEKPQSL